VNKTLIIILILPGISVSKTLVIILIISDISGYSN